LPGRDVRSEIWDEIPHDLLAGVVRSGEAFWAMEPLFVIERHGVRQEDSHPERLRKARGS